MTHGTLCVYWSHDVQDVLIGYRYFPRMVHNFLVVNWFSIFFKNNTYSEKNSINKYMLKVAKDMLI